MAKLRADKTGGHRTAYEKNKKRIFALQNTCGICGQPVNKKLKAPDPLAPCIDHIVPVSKNGHPSDIDNLQLAHWQCNRQKSDKIYKNPVEPKVVGNRNLPQSKDWSNYKA